MPFVPTNPICSVADVKAALRITTSTDDDRIGLAVDAASRQIEAKLARRFWTDTTTSQRLYICETPFLLEIEDVADPTTLTVESLPFGVGGDSVTWTSSDYQCEPLNQLLEGQTWPVERLRAVRSLLFPVYGGIAYPMPYQQALVRVTAKFGFGHIPTPVQKAAILQSILIFKSDDVPFGATAFGETGVVRVKKELHPQAQALLEPYFRDEVFVG